ncbi:MAG TPA: hypothetical protein VJ547_00365 [Candidatus Thermoplasmatota archaeon]|nr:hypothetical protein [Candidatus Thermoplasmatota archaeon]
MEPWKVLVALPVVAFLVLLGALLSNTSSGWDLFPYAWFSLTAAFTICFIVIIRWGFGPEDEEGADAAAQAESPGQ